jgi:aconitate hydratase
MQFLAGESRDSHGLTGFETFSIEGVFEAVRNGSNARVRAVDAEGVEKTFEAKVRIDTPQEAEYYRNGGILPYVVRQLAKAAAVGR